MTVSGAVLFAGAAPSASDLAAALAEEFGDGASAQTLDIPGKGPVDAAVVSTGLVRAMVAGNAVPLDAAAALRACHPVWWQGQTDAIAQHRSHVVITVLHPGEVPEPRAQALQEATIWSVIATVVAGLPGAVAVHSAQASAVYPADAYARGFSAAVESKQVPADLWTSVWVMDEPDGTHSAYTLGLDTFGARDLVIEHSRRPPSDLFRFLADTARYLITTGAVVEAGQTVGPTPSQQHPVRERHSAIHDAMVLEIGDEHRPSAGS